MGSGALKRLIAIILLLWPLGAVAQVSVPVYGNWCGPDYPYSPALSAPPIDPLDAACMQHDYCTAVQGRFDCGCDLSLMYELRNTRWPNGYIQSEARGIYDAIAVIPCTNPAGTAEKQSLFMEDFITDAVRGNAAPLDLMYRWSRLLSRGI